MGRGYLAAVGAEVAEAPANSVADRQTARPKLRRCEASAVRFVLPDVKQADVCSAVLVAYNGEIGSGRPRDTEHAAALRMLAMPMGIAALRALHRTPSRTFFHSHFTVTGH